MKVKWCLILLLIVISMQSVVFYNAGVPVGEGNDLLVTDPDLSKIASYTGFTKMGLAIDGHKSFMGSFTPRQVFDAMQELGLRFLMYQADSWLLDHDGTYPGQIDWIKDFASLAEGSSIDISIILMPLYGWEEQSPEWYGRWRDEIVINWMDSLKGYSNVKYFGLYWGEFFAEGLRIKFGTDVPPWQQLPMSQHDSNFKEFGGWASARGYEILHWAPSTRFMNLDPSYYEGKYALTTSFPDPKGGGWVSETPEPWTYDKIYPLIKQDMAGYYRKNKKAIAAGMWSREVTLNEMDSNKAWSYDTTSWFLQAYQEEAAGVEYLIFIACVDIPIYNEGWRRALLDLGPSPSPTPTPTPSPSPTPTPTPTPTPSPTRKLTVDSTPVRGVGVRVDGVFVGNTRVSADVTEGSHIVTVPEEFGEYSFVRWEDYSTNPTRTDMVTSDTTFTAIYEIDTSTDSSGDGSVETGFFGDKSVGERVNVWDGYIDLCRFMVFENGAARSISVYFDTIAGSPNNKGIAGIYADVNGFPETMLADSAEKTGLVQGWNTFNLIVQPDLVANTYYWLAVHAPAGNLGRLSDGEPNQRIGGYRRSYDGYLPIKFPLLSNPKFQEQHLRDESSSIYCTYQVAPPQSLQWSLTVDSTPVQVSTLVDGALVGDTRVSTTVTEGSHIVTVPGEFEGYSFVRWEDYSTNPTRAMNVVADTTVTAYYEAAPSPSPTPMPTPSPSPTPTPTPTPTPPTCPMMIQVMDPVTNTPVGGVSVQLKNDVWVSEPQITDANGCAYFTEIESGDYMVIGEAEGYAVASEAVSAPAATKYTLDLSSLLPSNTATSTGHFDYSPIIIGVFVSGVLVGYVVMKIKRKPKTRFPKYYY